MPKKEEHALKGPPEKRENKEEKETCFADKVLPPGQTERDGHTECIAARVHDCITKTIRHYGYPATIRLLF